MPKASPDPCDAEGCSSPVLCLLNVIDILVAAGVAACALYALYHGQHAAPPDVWVPVIAAGVILALSSLLNWLTMSCRLVGCAWVLTFSIVVDLICAAASLVLGVLIQTDLGTVEDFAKDVDLGADGSISSFPYDAPEFLTHLHTGSVAFAFFVFGVLQLCRAILSCVIKRKLQRIDLKETVRYPELAGSQSDFGTSDHESSGDYYQREARGGLQSDGERLDQLHRSISQRLEDAERNKKEAKRVSEIKRQQRKPVSYR